MDIIAFICNFIIGLEYHNKFKHVLLVFKYKVNTVLHQILYKYWTPYQNFEPFRMYSSTMYKWTQRLSVIFTGIFSPSYIHRTNKPQYMTQLEYQLILQYKIWLAQLQLSQHANLKISYFAS